MQLLRHLPRALFALALLACTDEETQFTVRYAPEYPRSSTVSVFGVFKDGRMSPESWDVLGPKIAVPFGGASCEVEYSEKLITGSPSLSGAVDDYARANGVTDDLLEQFAPAAKGDAILFITVAGHPPQTLGDAGTHSSSSPGSAMGTPPGGAGGRGHGMRGSQGSGLGSDRMPVTDKSVYEVSASLYSTHLHRAVGILEMTYSGHSVDEALRRFTQRLSTEMPGAKCAGWATDAKIDEEKIKSLPQ